jgi:predicted ATPase
MKNNFLHEICLKNLLSFGGDSKPLKLKSLNVIIGSNGTGKSNLLEAISLLRAAPVNLSAPVKESGGVKEWLWKGSRNPTASIEVIVDNPDQPSMPLRHFISFVEHGQRFEIESERIENKDPYPGHQTSYYYFVNEFGFIKLNEKNQFREENELSPQDERPLKRENVHPEESILSQLKDPERYPYLSYLSDNYSKIQQYREWSFGRYTAPRQPQKADSSSQYLAETCENLPLVLNAIRPYAKREIIKALRELYPQIDDFNVQISGGWVQLFLEEGKFSIPATRLSDGTLRFLCLLAILLNPTPPPLICIEEPELGLHPDILPVIADLLVSASARTQLIVTTHSDLIVDALTDTPEYVVVCEKRDGNTEMKRLDPTDLKQWLGKYRLGQLWIRGQIGGTR